VGLVQKDALITTIISYFGLALGYINKAVLFVLFLEKDQIGLLGLVLSVGVLFAQFSNFGVAYTVWRFFPYFKHKEKNNYGFIQLNLLLNLIGIVIFSLLAVIFKPLICSYYQEQAAAFVSYYYWILPLGISYSLFLTFDSILRSLFKNVVSTIATELILRLVMLVAIVAFAMKWIDFQWLVIVQSVSFIVPTLILTYQLIRNQQFHWRLSHVQIPKRFNGILTNYTLFSYVNFIGIMVVLSLDTMMVASMLGLSETGVYTTIIYIVSGILIPYKSLQRICAPLVAKYWKQKDMDEMSLLYQRVSSLGLFMGLSVFLGFWTVRDQLMEIIPTSFKEGITIFFLIMIGRVVDMYCGLNGTIFISSKKYKYDLIFTITMIISVVSLNLWLIPIYGVYGAAISTTIAYILYNICRVIFIYFAYRIHPFNWNQLGVMVLFLCSLAIGEMLPIMSQVFVLQLVFQWFIVFGIFLIPIYFLNLEKDSVQFINKFFLKKRLKKEKNS
jgi:O-antigen/teichoic acid export membrane protein